MSQTLEFALWLAKKVCRECCQSHSNWHLWDDLLQELSLAGWKALDTYWPQSPISFGTYCEWKIRFALKNYFRKYGVLSRAEMTKGLARPVFVSWEQLHGDWARDLVVDPPEPPSFVWQMVKQTCTPKEQSILFASFWIGASLAEIARQYGCSRARISQLTQRALKKLRPLLEKEDDRILSSKKKSA